MPAPEVRSLHYEGLLGSFFFFSPFEGFVSSGGALAFGGCSFFVVLSSLTGERGRGCPPLPAPFPSITGIVFLTTPSSPEFTGEAEGRSSDPEGISSSFFSPPEVFAPRRLVCTSRPSVLRFPLVLLFGCHELVFIFIRMSPPIEFARVTVESTRNFLHLAAFGVFIDVVSAHRIIRVHIERRWYDTDASDPWGVVLFVDFEGCSSQRRRNGPRPRVKVHLGGIGGRAIPLFPPGPKFFFSPCRKRRS